MKKTPIIIVIALIALGLGWWLWAERNDSHVIPAGNNQNATSTIPLSNSFTSEKDDFSILYPIDFAKDETYSYSVNPSRSIDGVKFTIPKYLSDKTNLGSDTYISVESIPGAINSCSAEIFLDKGKYQGYVDVGGHRYSIATVTGAGAGNRYEETVYATPVTGGCLAVRYFIHSSVFENYPEGSVARFDEDALKEKFDTIRMSLTIGK